MKPMAYFPGCSLEGTAAGYDTSTRALLDALEIPFVEIPDWTCCGASAAETVSPLLGLALSARNIALARQHVPDGDILVPCSACYLNLMHAREKSRQSVQTLADINYALQPEGLAYDGGGNIRHLLDFLKQDMDLSQFASKVQRPLEGLVAAPYYGCQCLRPYRVFDDPEAPVSMEPLLMAAGAEILSWSMGNKCCGASHMTTKPVVGMQLSGAILAAARSADVIVTVCPMCQMNLDAYQKRISRHRGEDLLISVVYLPQLLGLALGLRWKDLELEKNLALYGKLKETAGASLVKRTMK